MSRAIVVVLVLAAGGIGLVCGMTGERIETEKHIGNLRDRILILERKVDYIEEDID